MRSTTTFEEVPIITGIAAHHLITFGNTMACIVAPNPSRNAFLRSTISDTSASIVIPMESTLAFFNKTLGPAAAFNEIPSPTLWTPLFGTSWHAIAIIDIPIVASHAINGISWTIGFAMTNLNIPMEGIWTELFFTVRHADTLLEVPVMTRFTFLFITLVWFTMTADVIKAKAVIARIWKTRWVIWDISRPAFFFSFSFFFCYGWLRESRILM